MIVGLLLKRPDIDVNARNNYGMTALSLAVEKGYERLVSLIVEKEIVDTMIRDKWGKTPYSRSDTAFTAQNPTSTAVSGHSVTGPACSAMQKTEEISVEKRREEKELEAGQAEFDWLRWRDWADNYYHPDESLLDENLTLPYYSEINNL